MAFNIEALKKTSRGIVDNIANGDKKSYRNENPNLWKPTYDSNGNAFAVLRLLPSLVQDELPWIKTEKYFIENSANGKWYIENSRRMIGEADPMGEYIANLWSNARNKEEEAKIRNSGFRAQVRYACAALVVSDPHNKENEGRVVIYEFPKQIFDKIVEKAKVVFEGDTKVNVFDWTGGCNLRLKIYRKGNFPQFDRCEFDAPSAIPDDQIVEIAEKIQALDLKNTYLNPANFKSYNELRARMRDVFGISVAPQSGEMNFGVDAKPAPKATQPVSNATNQFGTREMTEEEKTATTVPPWANDSSSGSSDDEDFNRLLNNDDEENFKF